MPTILKSAVIGSGVISKEHLSFLNTCDRARIVGVCDLSPAAAQYAAQKFQAEAAFTDYRHLLESTQPDVVHILTPPQTHKRIATDCLEAGAHVICEKPITTSYQDFQELWATAERCDRRLMENHNYRFNELIQTIARMVEDGTLGEVQDIEVRMALNLREKGSRYADENLPNPMHKLPAGVIHDFITHLTYLALQFMPGEIDRVAAAWSNHAGDSLFKYDDLDAIVLAGQVHARLRFSAYTRPECFTLFVRGSRGYAETDLFQPYLRCVIPRPGGKQLSPLVNHFVNGYELMQSSVRNFRNKIMQRSPYEGLHSLLAQTYEALISNQPLPIQFKDMERTNRLVERLLAEGDRF
ncbi:MAG: Gfo/Idh/MocA family oxidoreductase [Leptolyngbyaceae cyanobacterium bins.59]|nr:Gfo/Idh/MocA family oxidoreductase [Leptolyngbyaceae cyanobacterium bins.59]